MPSTLAKHSDRLLQMQAHTPTQEHITALIAKTGLRRSLRRQDVLLRHGDAAQQLWHVESGWVKLTRQTPDGKETITGLCAAGDFFGEAALFPHASYPYHAEVVSDEAVVTAIPAKALREAMQQDAHLAEYLMQMLGARAAQAQLKLEHLSTLTAAQRIGCFLLRIAGEHSEGAAQLHIPVEKYLLASYLGMKPETFSRSLQQLKDYGVQVQGDTVSVTEMADLREFVCNSCSEMGMCESEAEGQP